MNATKFQVNPMNRLMTNLRKPKKVRWQKEQMQEEGSF